MPRRVRLVKTLSGTRAQPVVFSPHCWQGCLGQVCRRRGPALRPSWPSPASRQTAVSLAAPKTVLYRTGSKASANAGVSHSACRRSGCQPRVGHSHGSLDCDSKTVRDRPPFSLHLHRMSGPSLAFCGQDMPVKGNVQLFWDTIRFGAKSVKKYFKTSYMMSESVGDFLTGYEP